MLRNSDNTAAWVGTTDLGFLDVFHPGTKYFALLNVDQFGVVDKTEAVDRNEISVSDAMQLYRGLPIITNKIADDECRGVPHHLLGFLDTYDVWRVGRFVMEAEKTVCRHHGLPASPR